MNKDEKKIEEKIMQFAKELIAIRDTHNVAWLISEGEKASEKLAEELTTPIQESNREAVGEFDTYKCENAPSGIEKMTTNQAYVAGQMRVCMWIKHKIDEYLKERGK